MLFASLIYAVARSGGFGPELLFTRKDMDENGVEQRLP